MNRRIIDLKVENITLEDAYKLENYIVKGTLLIPSELLVGE